jgi:hypothetical protein
VRVCTNIAASVKFNAQVCEQPFVLRMDETHGQKHEVGCVFAFAARYGRKRRLRVRVRDVERLDFAVLAA